MCGFKPWLIPGKNLALRSFLFMSLPPHTVATRSRLVGRQPREGWWPPACAYTALRRLWGSESG